MYCAATPIKLNVKTVCAPLPATIVLLAEVLTVAPAGPDGSSTTAGAANIQPSASAPAIKRRIEVMDSPWISLYLRSWPRCGCTGCGCKLCLASASCSFGRRMTCSWRRCGAARGFGGFFACRVRRRSASKTAGRRRLRRLEVVRLRTRLDAMIDTGAEQAFLLRRKQLRSDARDRAFVKRHEKYQHPGHEGLRCSSAF